MEKLLAVFLHFQIIQVNRNGFEELLLTFDSPSRTDDRSFSFPKIKDTQKIRSSLELWSDPVSRDCWMFQQGTGGFFPQR